MSNYIIKRNGERKEFDINKINTAISKAMIEADRYNEDTSEKLSIIIAKEIVPSPKDYSVEEIQDMVEETLMKYGEAQTAKKYILYRNKRTELRNKPWKMDGLQQSTLSNKYLLDGESFNDWIKRVSQGNTKIEKLIRDKKFLFAGRILANRGLIKEKKLTYSNCYVITPPEDNIESIFDAAKKLARTFSYGGGAGINIGNLRPAGAKVNNAAKSTTGAVSFMDLFNLTTDIIAQKGRRGALLLSLPVNHPDIEEFINIKLDLTKLTKTNISVMITDDFMRAVSKKEKYYCKFLVKDTGEVIIKEIDAYKLFRKLCENNWRTAEPGMLFWDGIEQYNFMSMDKSFKVAGTNPCLTGDTLIQTVEGKKKIKDLVGTEPFVYAVNTAGELILIKASKVWLTRKNADLVEVKYDDNTLICTPDHKIFTDNRGWVDAKDLNENDNLCKYEDLMLADIVGEKQYKKSKVISVTELEYTEDVYDMTVPEVHNFIANDIVVHNCGEEPLPAGGSCLLGSINLSEFVCCPFTDNAYFDIDKFNDAVKTAVIGLDEVLDEGLEYHPLEEQRECVRKYRQIGLGVMGIADMLIKLGVVYGSDESLEICSAIAHNMFNNALYQSAMLAKENGPFPEYKDIMLKSPIFKNADENVMGLIKQYGLRHSALLTIPPCGSISLLLGVSGGIEPIFNFSYIRKTESIHDGEVFYKVYTPIVEEYMSLFGVCKEEDLPEYFIASQEIEYENRIKMQSVWQKYIDASISSTINLPNDATIDDVCDLYMKAWQYGLKGVTVYRDGCERAGVLINEDKKKKEKKEPIKVQVKDDDEDEQWAESKLVKRNKPQNEGETPSEDKMICPNCNEKLSFTGGCGICLNCGWSKCQ